MLYNYQSEVRLGEVAIYVNDLEATTEFYINKLGLTLQSQTESESQLGVQGNEETLIRLIETDQPRQEQFGLYHVAILVPDRPSLGAILRHFMTNQVQLLGGSDHSYSEAIYIVDNEGNQIEVYRDKPVEEWDIRENGAIVGVTEQLDYSGLLQLAQDQLFVAMPANTSMGHVHLSVSDAQTASTFYQNFLNMTEKFGGPDASWVASGNYHHHLAFNNWMAPEQTVRTKGTPGLAYYTIIFKDDSLFEDAYNRALTTNSEVERIDSQQFTVTDADGIQTKVVLKKE